MRNRFLVQIILVACIVALGLTGCKNPPWKKRAGGSGLGPESGVPPLGIGGDSAMGDRPLAGGAWQHGQFAPVLFDYDSARVRPSEVSKLETVAAYMRSNPGKLVIEGHCDERGTAEYNRALGENRALAAREELARLGVDSSRMSTISYGKDRPTDMVHDESGWARNRRCEFVIVNQ